MDGNSHSLDKITIFFGDFYLKFYSFKEQSIILICFCVSGQLSLIWWLQILRIESCNYFCAVLWGHFMDGYFKFKNFRKNIKNGILGAVVKSWTDNYNETG